MGRWRWERVVSSHPMLELLIPSVESIRHLIFLFLQQNALWTLCELVESTGCVVKPYNKYPNLLDLLLNFLKTEQSQVLRREVRLFKEHKLNRRIRMHLIGSPKFCVNAVTYECIYVSRSHIQALQVTHCKTDDKKVRRMQTVYQTMRGGWKLILTFITSIGCCKAQIKMSLTFIHSFGCELRNSNFNAIKLNNGIKYCSKS